MMDGSLRESDSVASLEKSTSVGESDFQRQISSVGEILRFVCGGETVGEVLT